MLRDFEQRLIAGNEARLFEQVEQLAHDAVLLDGAPADDEEDAREHGVRHRVQDDEQGTRHRADDGEAHDEVADALLDDVGLDDGFGAELVAVGGGFDLEAVFVLG